MLARTHPGHRVTGHDDGQVARCAETSQRGVERGSGIAALRAGPLTEALRLAGAWEDDVEERRQVFDDEQRGLRWWEVGRWSAEEGEEMGKRGDVDVVQA